MVAIVSFRNNKCDPRLLMDVIRADMELTFLISGPAILQHWNRIHFMRYDWLVLNRISNDFIVHDIVMLRKSVQLLFTFR